jgi:hypothetical protein
MLLLPDFIKGIDLDPQTVSLFLNSRLNYERDRGSNRPARASIFSVVSPD